MQVINRFRLRDFWTDHTRCENELRGWFQLVSRFDWDSAGALMETFPNLQTHLNLAAFDIRGSSYFIVAAIDYAPGRIWIRDVLPHNAFRTEAWKSLATGERPLESSYDDLAHAFPLRPIRDDEHLRQASARLDALVSCADRSGDEQDYLEVLSLLVRDYEDRSVPILPVSAAEVLRVLITEHRLSQVELIPMLGGKQRVTALLRGDRPLDLRQATRACRYFKLPPEVFMDPDDLEIELPKPPRRRS